MRKSAVAKPSVKREYTRASSWCPSPMRPLARCSRLMLAESLAAAKRLEEGIEAIDEALARSARNDERWCTPELLRIKGELLLQSSHPRARGQAERLFTESLEMARQQRALSWELRIAASISRLQRANGCIEDGPQLLAGVYSRFTEGFATADLRMAESLLDQFGRRGAANR